MAKSKASRAAAQQPRIFGPRYVKRVRARQRILDEFAAAQAAHDPARLLAALDAVEANTACRRYVSRWLHTSYKTTLDALRAALWQRIMAGTAQRVQDAIDGYAETLPSDANEAADARVSA